MFVVSSYLVKDEIMLPRDLDLLVARHPKTKAFAIKWKIAEDPISNGTTYPTRVSLLKITQHVLIVHTCDAI